MMEILVAFLLFLIVFNTAMWYGEDGEVSEWTIRVDGNEYSVQYDHDDEEMTITDIEDNVLFSGLVEDIEMNDLIEYSKTLLNGLLK